MKKVLMLIIMFVCSFCFMGLVNASYVESSWVESYCLPAPADDQMDGLLELGVSNTAYSFNKDTGAFTLTGTPYTSLDDAGKKKGVYYAVSDGVLFAYILKQDASVLSAFNVSGDATSFCVATRNAEKSSTPVKPDPKDDDNGGSSSGKKKDDGEVNNDVDNNYFDANEDDSNNSSDSGNYGTYSSNPNTGIEDYMMYLVPILIISGSTLILRKRFN